MKFDHNGHHADEEYVDRVTAKLLKTRFDRDDLKEFNDRYCKETEAYVNDCLGCNQL